jgi:glycosyltransferase involved in cell wall biosynthesis
MLSAGELLPFADLDGAGAEMAAATPMVSIVVAAGDDERTIGACLESIGRIQYSNYEVIVADEGSRDRSIEIAAATPGVRVVRGKFGAIDNEVARSARGELIAFTRADCIVDPEWLAIATAAIIEGGFDVCSGPVDCPHEGRGLALRVLSSLERRAGLEEAPRGDAVQLNARNLIIRKSSLSMIGGCESRVTNEIGGGDPCARMLAEGLSAGRCPAGFVGRQRDRSIGEFLRSRIRRGRDEAIGRATRQIAIGNNHAHAAHPAGR